MKFQHFLLFLHLPMLLCLNPWLQIILLEKSDDLISFPQLIIEQNVVLHYGDPGTVSRKMLLWVWNKYNSSSLYVKWYVLLYVDEMKLIMQNWKARQKSFYVCWNLKKLFTFALNSHKSFFFDTIILKLQHQFDEFAWEYTKE